MIRKKNKGRKIYFIFLTIYTVALCVAAAAGLSLVWDYAEEFEEARPENTIDAYVAELKENRWMDSMRDTVSAMAHEMQSDSECIALVKNMLSGDIQYSRIAAEEGIDGVSYALSCDGKRFGVVSLVEDESYADKVKFGQLPWKIAKESFDFDRLYSSVEITVPATFTVELNGNELGEEYIVEKDIKLDVFKDYYESCPNLPTKVTYRFDNVVGEIKPVVYDEDGNEFIIDESMGDSQYISYCDDAMLARLKEFAFDFSDRYFNYITGLVDPGYGYQRLATVMKAGSDLDERMLAAQDGLSWAHTQSLVIEDVALNSGINMGDGFYLADISTQTLTLEPGKGEVRAIQSFKLVVQDSANELRALMMELY